MKGKVKKITIIASIIVAISLLIFAIIHNRTQNVDSTSALISAEQRRAATYKEVEKNVAETDNHIEFSAFFTNDNKNVDGTCRRITSKDTLFIDVNVLEEGKLINGEIKIEGSNFNYSMFMIKDEVLKKNYTSDNVTKIELNTVNNGTQKLIFGDVIPNLKNNIKNYSNESSITLTGTYIPEGENGGDGEGVQINVTRKVTVDWYGDIKASLSTHKATYYYDDIKSNEINFSFTVNETVKELLLDQVIATVTIPQLNGFDPSSVECSNSNVEVEYVENDEDAKKIKIIKSSSVEENGDITQSLSRQNTFTITVTYPQEAFDKIEEYTKLNIPVTGQYIGYNNLNMDVDKESEVVSGIVTIEFTKKPVVTSEGHNYYYSHEFDVDILNKKHIYKPSSKYVFSKQSILNLYNNPEDKGNYEYTVRWSAYSGNQKQFSSYTMSESTDTDKSYGDEFDTTIIDNYTNNKGIYFSNVSSALGEDGSISVYNNDTNELIVTFTAEECKEYTASSPYTYQTPVQHIRVVTSKPAEKTYLYIYNLKEFDAQKIVEDFSEEEMEKFAKLTTHLTSIGGLNGSEVLTENDFDSVELISETSDVKISVEPDKINTQETKNVKIYIDTISNIDVDAKWKNGEFIVELPEDIINLKVNGVTSDRSDIEIVAHDVYKKDGKYLIRIFTKNENPEIYKLTIDCDITPDSRKGTSTKTFNLYAYNEFCNKYYNTKNDTYDVDSDNITNELVGTSSCSMEFVSPTSLITLESVSDYDESEQNEVTISPNVAEVENEVNQAKINLSLRNNYPYTVTGIRILGKIPYEGNKTIVNGKDMKSEFSTTMVETGIKSDNDTVQDKMVVYYSENDNPTEDINDSKNGWKSSQDGIDFAKVKSYLVLLQDYKIEYSKDIELYYDVKIPEGTQFNKTSYCTHAVYFDFVTDGGNIPLYTEPAKVGVKIVNKYNLELTKYKVSSQVTIPGVTYSLSCKEKDTEGVEQEKTRIVTTDANGKLSVNDLHAEIEYTLKEIKVPDTCELSSDVVTFKIDADGKLHITGKTKHSEYAQDNILKIELEDEVKVNLEVTKTKIGTTNLKINNVRFALTDENNNRKTLATKDGVLTFTGLSLNKTYTLTEISAPGGIALNDGKYKFRLIRNGSDISVQNEEGNLITGTPTVMLDSNQITSTLKVNVQDELRYSLDLTKMDLEGGLIQGVQFTLTGKGQKNDERIYTTNKKGKINVSGLYVGEEYVLKEIKALGYYLNEKEENTVTFKVERKNDKLELTQKDNSQNMQIDGNIVFTEEELKANISLTLKNEKIPTYNLKIIKIDDEGKELAGAQFKLKSLDTKIEQDLTINEDGIGVFEGLYEYDENKSFVTGLYELTETYAPEGYKLNDKVVKFYAQKGKDGKLEFIIVKDKEDEEEDKEDKKDDPNAKDEYDFIEVKDESETEEEPEAGETNELDSELEEKTITIEYTNKPIFNLKKEGENKELLPGAKFKIYKINEDKTEQTAKTIDGKELDEVCTDSNGKITANLPEGLYKAVETEAPEGYELPKEEKDRIHYFGIGASRPAIKSEEFEMLWQNSIGSDYITEFKSAVKTPDGGIIAVGSTDTNTSIGDTKGYGNQDGIIVKYSAEGKVEWSKLVGGEGYDELYEIEADPNGGEYAVVGYVDSSSINYNGENLREKDSLEDYGQSDGFIMMIDEEGNKKWAQTIGEDERDRINSVAINESGTVAVTGSYHDNGLKKGFVCTFDSSGGYGWHRYLNSTLNTSDAWGEAITATTDGFAVGVNFGGNLTIEGDSETVTNAQTNGTIDFAVLGFTLDGTCEWQTKIGSTQNDEIYDIIKYENSEGNDEIAVVGAFGDNINDCNLSRKSSSGTYDGMLIKLHEDGKFASSLAIGKSADTVIDSVETTDDGGLLLGGWTYSSSVTCGNSSKNIVGSNNGENAGFIVAIDESNNVSWNDTIQGSGFDSVDGVVQAGDGSYYAVGDFDSATVTASSKSGILTNNGSSYADAYVIKYGQEIIEAAIPEVKELTVTNNLKEFTITTEVGENLQGNRDGGTITGEYKDEYKEEQHKQFVETVKYGGSNKRAIDIKPKKDYVITKITINEKEMKIEPDEQGNVTIKVDELKNITENIHIVVVFSPKKYTITIEKIDKNNKQHLEGAEFEIKSKTGESKVYHATTNAEGKATVEVEKDGEYTIKETKAPEQYILSDETKDVKVPQEDTVDDTVKFENQKYSLVIVHHYLKQNGKETTDKVAEDDILEGKPGDDYTAQPKKDLEGLTLEKKKKEDIPPDDEEDIYVIPKEATGKYKENEKIEVIYYYEPTPIELTIHHYYDGTENRVILDGEEVPDEFEYTEAEVKYVDVDNYTVSAKDSYTLDEDKIYNELISTDYDFTNVTTQCLDEEGSVGELNTADITDEYEYVYDSEIVYYYKPKTHDITTEIIPHEEERTDEFSGIKETISDVEGGEITGNYDEEHPEDKRIKFVEQVEQNHSSEQNIIVTPDYGYRIKYVQINTTDDNEITTENVVYGKKDEKDSEGDSSGKENPDETDPDNTTDPDDVTTQIVDGKPTVALAKFDSVTADKHIITEFEPLNGKVNIHYVIREDNEKTTEHSKNTITDLVGEDYQTGPIEIEHYEVVGNSGNTKGEYTEDDIEVYYYYELKEYAYRVEYYYDNQIDEKETVHSSAKYDEIIDHYTNKPRKGYELVKKEVNDKEVDNVELQITDDPDKNVIKLYYEKANFDYTVKYYYDDIEDTSKTYTESAKYEDKITEYQNGDKEGYKLVKESPTNDGGDLELTITDDADQNVIKIYYQREYNITTEVMTHTETYSNGTVKTDVKGGSISGETDNPYEKVLKGNSNEQSIVITPDAGYQIVNIWVTNKADLISWQNSGEGNQGDSSTEAPQDVTELINYDEYLENGIVTLPEKYFTDMQSDKHIKVEFRKTTKVTVKYLEKVGDKYTNTELADTVVIDGYEGQSYTTTRQDVTYYKAATDSQNNTTPANAEGEMKADEIIVIYYYERIPAGITVKYLEKVLDDDGNEKGIAIPGYDEVHIEGFQGLDYHTQRQTIPNYVSTSPIELPDGSENVIYVEKSKNSQDGVYQEQPIEIVYWYERQFNISTKVITHEENRTNKQTGLKEKMNVEGGSITGQGQETLEKVIYNHSAQQRITVKPNEFYTIKYIAIVGIDRLGQEKRTIIYGKDADKDAEVICRENDDGSVTLSNFMNVKEDKRVEVEFEPIYGEVVVHHYIDGTGEQYHNKPVQVPSKEEGKVVENETIRDLIGEPYSTSPSDNIASIYELVDRSGKETGEITTDKIDVYYYYDFKGYEYRVEYYYDGELDEDETEKDEAKYGDKIIDYEKKERTGYKLEKVEPTNDDGELELSITDKVEDNVIKVYYVKDKFKYTIEYYYDDVLDPSKTETHEATYQDVISTYPDKSGDDYAEVDRKNVPLTISDDIEANVIKIYYKRQYKITTQVLTHKEEYSDGTVEENVKGGTISGTPETATTPTLQENVLKGDSNKKDIVITPDEGYTVADVWITEGEGSEKKPFDYEDLIKDGVITIPEGYFEDMDSDKNIEVEFRKISNVIVKYLEKTGDVYTDNELLPQYEIKGYETKPYTTSREVVLNYRSAVDPDGNTEPANAVGTMKADTVEVIYYYEKIPAGVTVKYVEKITDKDGNVHPVEIEGVEDKVLSGFVGEKYTTSRETIENYVPAEPPKLESTAKGVIYVDADKDEQSGVYTESPTEVYYWYERQFHIFTKIKPITEEGDKPGEGENPNPGEEDPNKHPNGGTISQNEDPDTPYEDVLRSQENKKSVEMIPDDGYRVKDVVINGESVDFSKFEQEDGSVVIPEGYFKDVQEDIVIEVEFERIPAKLTVKYVDEDTGEEIIPSEQTDGFVNDEYSTERKELENYAPSGEDPENAKGKLVEEGVIVTYYYTRQFKITTDVVEHYEFEKREVIEISGDESLDDKVNNQANSSNNTIDENNSDNSVPNISDSEKDSDKNEDSDNSLGGRILVKGGTISGEDEQPYELVNRGKENEKEIAIVPDSGYRIRSIQIKQPGAEIETLDLEKLLQEDGKEENNQTETDGDGENSENNATESLPVTLPVGYFKDVQSDKHIEVEFERIPAKLVVEYLDRDTQEKVAKSETTSGYVDDEYIVEEKQIPYYELVKDNYPENTQGKLGEGDNIVTYWYRKLLFNMSINKQFTSVLVNGNEVLGDDNKLAKVDISNTAIQNTNIIAKYRIIVTNTEEIAGSAKIVDQIPVGFNVSSQMKIVKSEEASELQLDVWQEVGNNLELTTRELQPGESAEYEVILEWDTSKKTLGNLENKAKILETYNVPNFAETEQGDNNNSCMVLISIKTGENRNVKTIIAIACFVLAGICTIIYVGTQIHYRRKNS